MVERQHSQLAAVQPQPSRRSGGQMSSDGSNAAGEQNVSASVSDISSA